MDISNYALSINGLNYSFGGPQILSNVNMQLPRGSRCILVGANGAGKSTLLKIAAGKILTKANVLSLGKNVFTDGDVGITYLGTEWASNPIVKREVSVSRLLTTLGAARHPERCAQLLDKMDVDPNWKMHQISDGQRRRVQIVLGLLEPWDLLLLDEVTVDLDVLVRAELLKFLCDESETRGATILYATHIFDGLGEWPTHLCHVVEGKIDKVQDLSLPFPELEEALSETRLGIKSFNSPLLKVVEKWLLADKKSKDLKSKQVVKGKVLTHWDVLSENMKQFGDKYYNYWG